MSNPDNHADIERSDARSETGYGGAREQQGWVPLEQDVSRQLDVRHRERSVSESGFQRLSQGGRPKIGRTAVVTA